MTRISAWPLATVAMFALCACTTSAPVSDDALQSPMPINQVAIAYVKLALALGERDPLYVDAYYGPPEWREQAKQQPLSLSEIADQAQEMISALQSATPGAEGAAEPSEFAARKHYLKNQLGSMSARARMLLGLKLSFDDEARALYDVNPPTYGVGDFAPILDRLDRLVPDKQGTLAERYNRYLEGFTIPVARLPAVMQTAIEAARSATAAHIPLPAGEQFHLSLVSGQPWSAYNWYQGHFQSKIQVNTDLPVSIGRAIELASHEGYPGHHVYNSLLESQMVTARHAVEFTVYALYSPQSFIAEGSADYGVGLAFPKDQRLALERKLFADAGFDERQLARYDEITEIAHQLLPAELEAGRRYLNGDANEEQTIAWLQTYALNSQVRAQHRISFFNQYRAYIVNYSYGKTLVGEYVERHAGPSPDDKWSVYSELLSRPHVPTDLMN